ncbi:MAG: Ldh family oxidoreductase [Chloroflexota bacterium]
MAKTPKRFQASDLQALTKAIFMAVETPDHIASIVAEIIVKSNLTGHDSHGVLRIPKYLREIEAKTLVPTSEPSIIKETANLLIVDAHNGFGHYTAQKAMRWAIKKAQEADVCCVAFRQMGHMGRMGEYAEIAAKAGCISFITAGGAGDDGARVVPYGGAQGVLWPNPLTVGVPSADDEPFILDMATSVLSEGNLQVARSENSPLPPDAIVDKAGMPTTSVADFYDGGYLRPFGGHKGYGIALLMTLLGGLSGRFDPSQGIIHGEFMQVINVNSFLPIETYQTAVKACLDNIRTTPATTSEQAVLIPGDKARRHYANRAIAGIDIPEVIWQEITRWARKLNVSADDFVS